ncbi:MAG TPA: TerC family protein [Xanthobacteraceae bacterium]|nr:TerC family protein [Xanthobacteraceae bacterium]
METALRMEQIYQVGFWAAVVKIIWINILLSGDNAIVIALACRRLPRPQRRWGMIIGAGVASILLIVFTGVVTTLMTLPYLKLVGGCALLWIAFRLLVGDAEEHHVEAVEDLWRAVRIVVVADIVMSLDNVIAVAAAAGGSYLLLGLGLTVSIPVVIAGAALIMALLGRFPVLVWAGAALLGWIAGGLIAEDPALRQFLPATGSLTFAPHSIIFGRSGGHGPEITVNPLELAFSLAGAVVVLAAALWSLRSRRSTATES